MYTYTKDLSISDSRFVHFEARTPIATCTTPVISYCSILGIESYMCYTTKEMHESTM